MNRPMVEWAAHAPAAAAGWVPIGGALIAARHGGKAANLGRMIEAGLPVPPGAVFGTEVLEAFLAETGLGGCVAALDALPAQAGFDALEAGAAKLRAAFASTPWPAALSRLIDPVADAMTPGTIWAVRSSAVGEDGAKASYAGLMDSVLGVDTRAGLEAAIRQVWASRWSARALAYERRHGTLGAMAVIVQRQIDPAFAGVLFTRSPDPAHDGQMLCEYCAGLADKLVAGEITPASLRIDRDRLVVTAHGAIDGVPMPGAQSVLELARAARAVEALFGGAQDIEFAIDRSGKLWIVQARPVTTSSPRGRRIVWSNANVNENFPDAISPLLYSIVAPGYSAYFGNLGRAFGLSRQRLARMRGDLGAIVGVHAGRLYYNLTAIHAVLGQAPFGDRLCAWFDDFTGASDPVRPTAAPRGFVRGLRDAGELVRITLRTTWQYLFIERRIRAFESRVDAYAQASDPARLGALDVIALRDLLRGFLEIRLQRWTDASLADAAAMICYGLLKSLVRRALGADDPQGRHNDLLKGLSGLRSAEPVEALWGLARQVRGDPALRELFAEADAEGILARIRSEARFRAFGRSFDDYLDAWGFRCSGELMLTVPSFQERPGDLVEIVRGCAQQSNDAPQARLAGQRAERLAATRDLIAAARSRPLFGRWRWPSFATVLPPMIAAAQGAIGLRERARLKQALLYSRLRRVALEIGARLARQGRLAAPADVFFLTAPELDELLSGHAMFPEEVGALAELRRRAHERVRDLRPADVIVATQGEYPSVQAEAAASPSTAAGFAGVSVCGGRVVGPARVLTDVAQTRSLRQGDVLITRQTDPGWAPAFVLIGGLVLERGGMLSHGAILAREYGIPTVVGVQAATERIADGRIVEVDGDRGEVRLP